MNIAPPDGRPPKRRHLHLNFITVPLISVLLLLACGVFNGRTLRDGIVGTNGIEPLNIMALFISLAYISISLDATGLLRFLAFWVASKGGSSGRVLFSYLYLFFLVCGIIVGNDPVILSGTAFLAYFTRVAGITPPTAWIFSQFAAANMASVVLVSSNPTNLVLSGAFSISFLTYAAHVVLPFLAAAFCVFPLLFVLFRTPGLIPARIDVGLTQAEVRATLIDARGAIFGSVLLLVTLVVLVGVSTIGAPVWMVTVPPAVIMLMRDVWYDWANAGLQKTKEAQEDSVAVEAGAEDARPPVDGDEEVVVAGAVDTHQLELHDLSSRAPTIAAPGSPILPSTPVDLKHPRSRPPLLLSSQRFFTHLHDTFPTVTHVLERLPIALLPFAFLMFILVQGLASQGWVALCAKGWAAWVRATGSLGAVGGMGFLACLLCNICGTNIGATILLARVLQIYSASLPTPLSTHDQRALTGAIYALALGSNFGAFTLTFSASLAGLLWRHILVGKGIHVRAREFLLTNLPISLVAMGVGCAVLVGEVYVEYR
ncbi:uncharacterized protein BXZ73DRAFT_93066 [Epithele typhae]|uniref:uncharacterized protein n=1 Tax=Epithele typhae TaxID=378194 RepID=UPI0020079EFE|nr:uncharacterized protein BXZ73DRAFT_93066 [Epithele typhae]KAH9912762.1 hypothetical protein BXZ73DRAFT_93066 [Epithele typhae]